MQHEYGVSLVEAYHMAMALHDADVKEFVVLHNDLPYFGEYQELAYDYVQALGITLQGVWGWHCKNNLRYKEEEHAYVEPEYKAAKD